MRAARSGYTLLEVLLAMTIAVLVLAAVYSFVGYQLRYAQAGREIIERVTLARALCNRLSTDITGALAQNDPARYRRSTDTTGGTPDSTTTAATAGTTASATATGTSGTGSTGTAATGSSSTGTSSTAGSTDDTSSSGGTSSDTPVDMPLGVVGSATELNLFVSRVPIEVFGSADGGGQLTCDQRRISYWLGGEGLGLCRLEARLITGEEATTADLPTGDVSSYVLAPEVQSVEFSYYDGSSWTDSWDSTAPGPDGTTPLGSPRAIAIKLGVASAGRPGDELKYYRHVVAIPTANGAAQSTPPTPEAGTSP
ncbi:MAG: prepilin-type N-terminal cleavage/methylation domain-containing protein [Gemmataceae bacterium]